MGQITSPVGNPNDAPHPAVSDDWQSIKRYRVMFVPRHDDPGDRSWIDQSMNDIDPERVLSMGIDWSGCPLVTRSIGMLSGQWRVRNTRISVDALVTNYNSGYDPDDLCKMFPNLSVDIAREIIRYAYDQLPKRRPTKGCHPAVDDDPGTVVTMDNERRRRIREA